MSDLKLSSQVQFALRSTQVERPGAPGVAEIFDSGVTQPYVEHFADQGTNRDIAALSERALARPTLPAQMREQVLDSLRNSDGVAQRAALVAAAHVVGNPGLMAGLMEAGRQVNRLVDANFAGHPDADAIRVGATHRFLEALREAGDPAARAALQMSSLPAAAAVAVSFFDIEGAGRQHLEGPEAARYVAEVGGRAIDRVYGHEGAGSGNKVEITSAFIDELTQHDSVSAHAGVVRDLMQSVTHERVKTLLGRCALQAFTDVRPEDSTERVLAHAGQELYGPAGVRASSCDLDRANYATTAPVAEGSKQLMAAKTIAGWMASHGSSDVRELAAMTVQTRSPHAKANYLDVPYRTLFETVVAG